MQASVWKIQWLTEEQTDLRQPDTALLTEMGKYQLVFLNSIKTQNSSLYLKPSPAGHGGRGRR